MEIINLTKKNLKVDKKDVGGKSLPIMEMASKGIPVPISYSVGYEFFESHLKDIGFWDKINIKFLTKNNSNLQSEINRARKMINNSDLSLQLLKQIDLIKNKSDFWAVRSSANIEDSKNKSWAGGFESYIGIKNNDIGEYIKKVWASVFADRVVNYLDKPSEIEKIKMGVLLQEAINSDVSGVCFTRDPFEDDSDEMVIEAVFGIGEYLVQGEVIPDRYLVDKEDLILLEVNFNEQSEKLKFFRNNDLKKVKNTKSKKQKLSGKQIIELAKVCKKIEEFYKNSRDIEWCFGCDKIYILQSRPITT